MERVLLGLSGGVDSAQAALCLREQGYAVEGVWLDLGFGDPEAARQTARELEIPFSVFDASGAHEQLVRAPFGEAYCRGLTPNPCALCNRLVKLPSLLAAAEQGGIRYIATGHYGRTVHTAQRNLLLTSGGNKDQSYMLALLDQETLGRLLLPLAGLEKSQVRSLAGAAGLNASGAKDSQDICFIPDGDYGAWMEARGLRLPEGNFVDPEGRVLGRHLGAHRYTVGQRRGLGVSAASRLYVKELRPERREVVLCTAEELLVEEVAVEEVNWVSCLPKKEAFTAGVKLRSGPRMQEALVIPEGEGLRIRFPTPVRKPAPGQLAAGYEGELLLFGAVIR